MPAIQDPNLGFNYGWTLGEDGWNTGVDDNWKMLGTLLHLSVIDKDLTAPPGSPAEGDRYLVPIGATGPWAGQGGNITCRMGGTWVFYPPKEGWQVWVADEALMYVRHGSAWTLVIGTTPYDIHVTFNGKPDSGITLARVILPRTTTFPAGLSGSYAKVEVVSTDSKACSITKNGVSIGSVNWAAGIALATFTFTAQVVFAAGDMMEITAPATVDVTLADIAMTLVGWK